VVVSVVTLFFVAGAVQPIMADAIAAEGGQAFGFLLVGLAGVGMLSVSILALPRAIGGGVGSGTLEALMATPASLPRLLIGMSAYELAFALARTLLTLGVGWALGANLQPSGLLAGIAILVLIAVVHYPVALIGSALVLAFRTSGPLPQGVMLVSTLLGGAYYPTHVIPSWLESVSTVVPLTYGLRAMRRVLLEGEPIIAVLPDLTALVAFGAALMVVGVLAMRWALRYARLNGTLSQY
jgi:ABC-2 type transport system permease protein